MTETWPEQDAVEWWWRQHRHSLKTAVTAHRLERDAEIERLKAAMAEAIDEIECEKAGDAIAILKHALGR